MASIITAITSNSVAMGSTVGVVLGFCSRLSCITGPLGTSGGAIGASASAGAILGSVVGNNVFSAFAGSATAVLASTVVTFLFGSLL